MVEVGEIAKGAVCRRNRTKGRPWRKAHVKEQSSENRKDSTEDRAVREDEIKTKRQKSRDLKEGQLQCEMSQPSTSSSWTPPKNQGGKEL